MVDSVITEALRQYEDLEALKEFLGALHSYLIRKYMAVGGLSDNSQEEFDKILLSNGVLKRILKSNNVKKEFFDTISKGNHLIYADDECIRKLVMENEEAKKIESKLQKICNTMLLRYPHCDDYRDSYSFALQSIATISFKDNENFLDEVLLKVIG